MAHIKKYAYTDEDVAIAAKHDITQDLLGKRLASGWAIEKAITVRPRKHREDLELARLNGISPTMYRIRKSRGWSRAEACTIPPGQRRQRTPAPKFEKPLTDNEVIEAIGRIKYLNKRDFKEFPIIIPEPMKRRIEQMDMSVDEIEEVRV